MSGDYKKKQRHSNKNVIKSYYVGICIKRVTRSFRCQALVQVKNIRKYDKKFIF